MNQKIKVLIDTDVDIDDWMAILYLLKHPSVEVLGITTTGCGAAHLTPGTRNARNLTMPDGDGHHVATDALRPGSQVLQRRRDLRSPARALRARSPPGRDRGLERLVAPATPARIQSAIGVSDRALRL